MDKVKIKLTGSYADVMAMTKRFESFFGIENIYQMSGIMPSADGSSLRYIDVITSPPNATIVDLNNKTVKGSLLTLSSERKEAVNG